MWEWLGEPLAVDFANTVKRRGDENRELLRSGADLAEWSRLQDGRVPPQEPAEVEPRLEEVRALRDAVIAVLHAARGGPRPAAATQRVNAAARAVPLFAQLRGGALVTMPAAGAAPLDELLARVAVSAIEQVSGGEPLGFCNAPSCGQFFAGGRAGRRWCSDACGTRARVARHARRA
jgi:predicted RNA-binding Zn ribbon-like protein